MDNAGQVPDGWISDTKGEWHRADRVCRLVQTGARVDAVFVDGSSSTLTNLGSDIEAAYAYRRRIAELIVGISVIDRRGETR